MNSDSADTPEDSEGATSQSGPPPSGADLARAYTNLNSGLSKSFGGAGINPVLDAFRRDAGLTKGISDSMRDAVRKAMPKWEPSPPIQPVRAFDPSSFPLKDVRPYNADIAESTERAAELMQLQHEAIAQLVALTAENLKHAEAQRETADRTERFTRRMTWASLIVSGASLVAAIAAIVVSIATASS